MKLESKRKVRIVVAVDKSQINKVDALSVLNELLPLVDGKGGGAPHLAQGGGVCSVDSAEIDKLLASVSEAIERSLKSRKF